MKQHFLIDPSITFLNFGSFGACNKPTFNYYQQLQLELESNPVKFITQTGLVYLQKSRQALGNYIHCHEDDIVLVQNPTFAVNLIAKNMNLQPKDEVLATNIEYGACDKTWNYYCNKAGAKYVRQPITLPLETEEKFVEEFFKGVTENTKLIFLSHITSSTALIFPVKKIIEKAQQLNIKTFIDGAHAPGHVPLNLKTLGADFYTGACHKWMMTPKGCTFLYVKNELQNQLEPFIMSWGYQALFPSHSQFLDYHQMNGTKDFTAFCTLPVAIQFMHENNWEQVSSNCKQMVYENANRFETLLQTKALAPLQENFIGQMLSLEIQTNEPEKLATLLFEKYKIEIPVFRQENKCYIRFSLNAMNTQHDLDVLYNALKEIV